METLQIGARIKKVPSTWNEMKRPQLLAILAHLYGPIHHAGSRIEWLALLTGFPLLLLSSLAPDVLAQLLPLVDFLTSEDHLLTAQLLPTLRLPGRHPTEPVATWHGPRASLSNVTFGEFIFADTFFVQYSLYHRPEHLDKFLAVLYRPARRVTTAAGLVAQNASPEDPDWNGDVRVPFNEHQLEARTPRIAPLSDIEKRALLTWFRGCRTQLGKEYPDVFAAADETAKGPQKAPEWERVLRKLSGGAFGPVQQTAAQPLRLILADMQDAAVEFNRFKSQNPS